MPFPFTPNTAGITAEIVSLLSTLKLSDNVTPAYGTVVLGGIKEYLPQGFPYANVLLRKHQSKRKHQGAGDIVERLLIDIRSVYDYSDAGTAETQLIAVHDVLLPALHKHATLASTQGVYHAQVVENSGIFEWLYFKPEWYRLDLVTFEVVQYYLVSGGIVN